MPFWAQVKSSTCAEPFCTQNMGGPVNNSEILTVSALHIFVSQSMSTCTNYQSLYINGYYKSVLVLLINIKTHNNVALKSQLNCNRTAKVRSGSFYQDCRGFLSSSETVASVPRVV